MKLYRRLARARFRQLSQRLRRMEELEEENKTLDMSNRDLRCINSGLVSQLNQTEAR